MGHADRTHAVLGSSSAGTWINCPGSVFLIKDLPPYEASEKALEGTKAHEIAEIVATDFLDYKVHGTDPLIRSSTYNNYTNEMLEHAQAYKDTIWNKGLEQTVTGKAFGFEEQFFVDTNLDIGGIVDFWCVYIDERGKRAAYILDYKYGYYFVEAKNNQQLMHLSAGLLTEIRRLGKDLDYIRAAIFQPRANSDSPYRETKFTAKQLDAWIKKARKVGTFIFVDKKPKFKVGRWCDLCRARNVCKDYAEYKQRESAVALVDPNPSLLPRIDTLSDETLVKLWKHSDELISYFKGVKSAIIGRTISGNPVPGVKVVSGSSRRNWLRSVNSQDLESLGLTKPYTEKILGITAVESLLTKKYGRAQAKELIEPLIELKQTAPIIVDESDPRPQISDSVQLLDEVTDEDM